VVVHTYNLITPEAEAGASEFEANLYCIARPYL
jgi:hypothetical protein